MKAVLCTIGISGWYGRGVARLINSMHEHSFGYEIQAWVNTLPYGAPEQVTEDGYDYTAYCAKPYAMLAAHNSGADIVILADAAFYAVRPIAPLVRHIETTGYYLCDNGNKVGEWCCDRALMRMNVSREDAMNMRECSSYCVGLDLRLVRPMELLRKWCDYASDRLTFPGPHTSLTNPDQSGRNRGLVSHDARVMGHRHDQSALSVLANRLGMTDWPQRPRFTAYKGSENETTCLVNEGGL